MKEEPKKRRSTSLGSESIDAEREETEIERRRNMSKTTVVAAEKQRAGNRI
jgi:hypothetical protein